MQKIKLPNGLRDEVGIQATKKDILGQQILREFRHKGYTRIMTPLLEQEELFQNYELKDQMYKLVDANGKMLVLRPDLTLPVARFLANNNVPLPQKFYYLGERLSIGRQLSGQANENTQAGVELIGFPSVKAEVECLLVIHWISQKYLQDSLTVELGDARLVDQVLASLQIDDKVKNQLSDALFNKNLPAYQELVKQFQDNPYYSFLKRWPRLFGSVEELVAELTSLQIPPVAQPIINDLVSLAKFVKNNLAGQSVIIDLSSLVPQKYYTGMIFKAYSGQSNDYVISGGRYDKLLTGFQEASAPAVGLGINIDLLAQLWKKPAGTKNKLVFCQSDAYAKALQLIAQHSNYSLALSADLAGAQKEAAQAGMELITVGSE
ncbi:ATP phosphoribosyltransferase regulatory subunit [Limosilactobacillus sp.]|uniref:ATP phosphoribosyltransferase regulatory subunit n=1 Tax=Limosilactobacillus sp. TaxID=2773925 RepID=UPI00345EC7A3